MKTALCVLLVVPLALPGCGGGTDETPAVLYKSAGSVQCAASQMTQARLDAAVAGLRTAGATVAASSCAVDGMPHPALCGTDSGELFSVTVPPTSVTVAQQAGFRPASDYPSAKAAACQ
jgi:hypothetical protein